VIKLILILFASTLYAQNWMSKADIAKANAGTVGTITYKDQKKCELVSRDTCHDITGKDLRVDIVDSDDPLIINGEACVERGAKQAPNDCIVVMNGSSNLTDGNGDPLPPVVAKVCPEFYQPRSDFKTEAHCHSIGVHVSEDATLRATVDAKEAADAAEKASDAAKKAAARLDLKTLGAETDTIPELRDKLQKVLDFLDIE